MVVVNVSLPIGAADLWWPNELGPQAMHTIIVTFAPLGGAAPPPPVVATRRMGFRVFVIVTDDDTQPQTLAGVDGSGTLTMRWRVNGANVWARGADVIPMEQVEGRQTDTAYRTMLASASQAHFNTIRVDGIDLIFPDVFYDVCDELGLMVYHDAQYSQGNVAPANTSLQTAEILHTVRRLSAHPSWVLTDGCNECGGHGLYASFVMTTIATEDPSRPPWPTSPSNG